MENFKIPLPVPKIAYIILFYHKHSAQDNLITFKSESEKIFKCKIIYVPMVRELDGLGLIY